MSKLCDFAQIDDKGDGWLGREPTTDEQEVVEWIASRRLPQRILHVGIGTAYLTQKFGTRVIQGLTKDGGEARHATRLQLNAIVCNKYDVNSYQARLLKPFDCIVDVNIRSYACCDEHFHDYMSMLFFSLSATGVLVTNKRGLDYLRPTSLDEVKSLSPAWSVAKEGNVVILRARPRGVTGRMLDLINSMSGRRNA